MPLKCPNCKYELSPHDVERHDVNEGTCPNCFTGFRIKVEEIREDEYPDAEIRLSPPTDEDVQRFFRYRTEKGESPQDGDQVGRCPICQKGEAWGISSGDLLLRYDGVTAEYTVVCRGCYAQGPPSTDPVEAVKLAEELFYGRKP